MLAAIVYVLESGCSWRKLPGSFPVHWRTAHRRFAEWVEVRVMSALHQAALDVLGSVGAATSSSAAWSGLPGSGAWSGATSARLPTSSASCAWPAL